MFTVNKNSLEQSQKALHFSLCFLERLRRVNDETLVGEAGFWTDWA